MAELEQRVQQLEGGVRELLDRIDRLTNRMDRFAPEISGPSAEDIQRFFGGRVFGVIGHRGEYGGWGGSPGALYSLSLRFTVQGERVEVETATVEPHDEQSALARLSLRALVPEGGDLGRPPLPLTLTLEERAARLRVCGREHDFNSYACSGRRLRLRVSATSG